MIESHLHFRNLILGLLTFVSNTLTQLISCNTAIYNVFYVDKLYSLP